MMRSRGPGAAWLPVGALALLLLTWSLLVGNRTTETSQPDASGFTLASLQNDGHRERRMSQGEREDERGGVHHGEEYHDLSLEGLDAQEEVVEVDAGGTTSDKPTPTTAVKWTVPSRRDSGPINAVIIAESEAGSSLLLHLLSRVPDSFSLFEPFRNFKYDPRKTLNGSFDTLFSCNFARDGATLSEVAWPGAAREHILRGLADTDVPDGLDLDTYRARMLASRHAFSENESDPILRKCLSASTKIVETIRFTGYIRILPKNVINERLRVIHILRHPARLVEAQTAAGLHRGGNITNETWVHGLIKELCDRVDGGIRVLRSQVPPSHILFLRFEDLMKAPAAVTKIVYDFLGVKYDLFTPEIERWVDEFAGGMSTTFNPSSDEPQQLRASQLAWPQEVVESCKDTLRAGGYL